MPSRRRFGSYPVGAWVVRPDGRAQSITEDFDIGYMVMSAGVNGCVRAEDTPQVGDTFVVTDPEPWFSGAYAQFYLHFEEGKQAALSAGRGYMWDVAKREYAEFYEDLDEEDEYEEDE